MVDCATALLPIAQSKSHCPMTVLSDCPENIIEMKEGQETHWAPFLGYSAKFESDPSVEMLIAEEVRVFRLPCAAISERP